MSTLGRLTVGNSNIFDRLARGRVTIRTFQRLVQWLSNHWPADLEWPADIERPEPKPSDDSSNHLKEGTA